MSGTIEAAEAAAARGLWAAGFVAYEAAPGLDPSLTVAGRRPDDPFAKLPLAWFALFERQEETLLPEPQEDALLAGDAWEPSSDARDTTTPSDGSAVTSRPATRIR